MKIMPESEAENLLERNGLPITKRKLCKSLEEAIKFSESIGYPVVLKAISEKIIHKTEKNAVRIDINKSTLEKNFKELTKLSKDILVQKQVTGQQVIIGIKKDPTFNHIILVGLGGIFTEVLKDFTIKKTPVTKKQAQEMLEQLKAYNILNNFRNQKTKIKDLIPIIEKVSQLPKKYPNLKELDINPVIINDKEAKIVDARIIFE